MPQILNVKEYHKGIEAAINYIHGKWGSKKNYPFYRDAMIHSSLEGKPLPRFYLLIEDENIIGCSALITNDFISRHDLFPWMACLFVDEKERGNEYGKLLIEHAEKEAKQCGFSKLYLTTGHDGYYEKYGWTRMEDGIDLFSCQPSRIYFKEM